MSELINDEVVKIINDPESRKVLATVDPEGNPHVVFKASIQYTENGYIKYLELIESSQTNKNMVYSIWNDRKIAINVNKDDRSYQLKGIPRRAIIYGSEFEEDYVRVKEQLGADLSTIWLIEPVELIDETLESRKRKEEELHPILKHLDQIVKKEEQ